MTAVEAGGRRLWPEISRPATPSAKDGGKKRSQVNTKLEGTSTWIKRSKVSWQFMAMEKVAKEAKVAKKFKDVRREK